MEQIKSVKPREYAIEQLKWYIQEKKLGPHAKLPSERELCQMWGLNRTTLRAAVRRLTQEQILYSEKGSGTYVAPPKFCVNLQNVKSTSEAFRGSGNFLWTDILKLQIIQADSFLADALQIAEGDPVFYLKRSRRKNNHPFRLEESFINYALCEGIENHNFTDESLFKVLRSYGLLPGHGTETIGMVSATEQDAELLDVEPEQALFQIQGITADDEGRILEYFRSLTRPDQIRFSSVLKKDGDEEG